MGLFDSKQSSPFHHTLILSKTYQTTGLITYLYLLLLLLFFPFCFWLNTDPASTSHPPLKKGKEVIPIVLAFNVKKSMEGNGKAQPNGNGMACADPCFILFYCKGCNL